jgi:metalloprotein, YbeY/UPF0054 family
MELLFEDEYDLDLELDYVEEAKKVIEAVLQSEEVPYEVEVELLLTNNANIQLYNKEHRGIDTPTDVLSFPMIEFPKIGAFDFLEENDYFFNPDTGLLPLGTILISKEKVVTQASEYQHSIQREYAFLIAHSMLHLLGYDHMDKESCEQMEERQKMILDSIGITRTSH